MSMSVVFYYVLTSSSLCTLITSLLNLHCMHTAVVRGESTDRGSREVDTRVHTKVMVDSRVPLECGSPGWTETPRDVAAPPGSYIFLNCRSALPHKRTYWLVDGREDVTTSPLADRVTLYHKNSTLRLGPLRAGDPAVVLGCRVWTREYGLLPSPLGTISVLSKALSLFSLSLSLWIAAATVDCRV